MEIYNLLEKLKDNIENSWSIPLTGVALVKRKELLNGLEELKRILPDEIEKAKWINEERQRYLFEAQQEAAFILKEAENRIVSMVDENEITRKAYEQANETIINAQKTARDIKHGSLEYADEVLTKMEESLKEAYLSIHKNKEELKGN